MSELHPVRDPDRPAAASGMRVTPTARTILVAGATGTVGREVVRALVERGATVRALVRSPARASALPPSVERVAGDLGDASAVDHVLTGADAAFYVSPHEPDEERIAEQFVRACEQRRTRLVFVGVHADARTRLRRLFARLMVRALVGGHYAPKFRISERARTARTDAIVLMPTNFFQNDELFRPELLAGEFVQPFSAGGINRVDVRDVGDAAARALLDPAIAPGAYPVVGPASLSGADAAAAWSRALGREVRDVGAEFERFATIVAQRLEGKKRDDFLSSFRAIRKFTMATDPRAVAATTALLGRPPRTYDDYVRETCARWQRAGE